MKAKVILTRDFDGSYNIWDDKADLKCYDDSWVKGVWKEKNGKNFLDDLCSRLTKKWLGLKRHLPASEKGIIRGTLEVKFTPDKRRGG